MALPIPGSTATQEYAMKSKERCEAFARSTGKPCQAQALPNGRCKNHGGLSTGPKTPEGRKAIGEATRKRMASGKAIRDWENFYRLFGFHDKDAVKNSA